MACFLIARCGCGSTPNHVELDKEGNLKVLIPHLLQWTLTLIELLGVGVIVAAVVMSTVFFGKQGLAVGWETAFQNTAPTLGAESAGP